MQYYKYFLSHSHPQEWKIMNGNYRRKLRRASKRERDLEIKRKTRQAHISKKIRVKDVHVNSEVSK
tara:strand:- start:654 stop:851 length:198 start_codon:yes stop_codon:yes gene_type:complete